MLQHDISIEIGAKLPSKYQWGAFVGGSVWMLIRRRDGATIRARTGTDDGCFTAPELPGAIAEAFEDAEDRSLHAADGDVWERA